MEKKRSIFDIHFNNRPFRDQIYKEMLTFYFVIDSN